VNSKELVLYLVTNFPNLFSSLSILENDNILITLVDKNRLELFFRFLKRHTLFQFSQLLDLWALDFLLMNRRFQVNYMVLSLFLNLRIILRCNVEFKNLIVPSVCNIYPSANWLEREAFDLYGVYFDKHPDLRRILTDYAFEGHPMRKDFPLVGFWEVRYSVEHQKVILEPVVSVQEYRFFDFLSPWDLTQH